MPQFAVEFHPFAAEEARRLLNVGTANETELRPFVFSGSSIERSL